MGIKKLRSLFKIVGFLTSKKVDLNKLLVIDRLEKLKIFHSQEKNFNNHLWKATQKLNIFLPNKVLSITLINMKKVISKRKTMRFINKSLIFLCKNTWITILQSTNQNNSKVSVQTGKSKAKYLRIITFTFLHKSLNSKFQSIRKSHHSQANQY